MSSEHKYPSGLALVILAFKDVLNTAVEKRKSQEFQLGDWLIENRTGSIRFMRDHEDVTTCRDFIKDPRFKDYYRKATHGEICDHLYKTGASAPCMY